MRKTFYLLITVSLVSEEFATFEADFSICCLISKVNCPCQTGRDFGFLVRQNEVIQLC